MEQGTTQASNNSMKTGIIAVALIALLIGGAVFYTQTQKNNNTTQNATPTGAMTQATETPSGAMTQGDSMTASNYKNGTYEATGNYVSPGGPEEIGVSVTITDGIITAATVTPMTERATSQRYQGIFQENFSPLVVGKNIDEVQLDKVSGSSLAPKGFNDALTKIKVQAQS